MLPIATNKCYFFPPLSKHCILSSTGPDSHTSSFFSVLPFFPPAPQLFLPGCASSSSTFHPALRLLSLNTNLPSPPHPTTTPLLLVFFLPSCLICFFSSCSVSDAPGCHKSILLLHVVGGAAFTWSRVGRCPGKTDALKLSREP